MNADELLRTTLRAKAQESRIGLTLDDVRRNAARRRSRSLWRATAVAAAAAVVVGVPSVLLMSSPTEDVDPAPVPTPSATPTTAPTTSTPSPTEPASELRRVPRGDDVTIAWISDGAIHRPGGTDVTLPAGAWDAFTPYHGGWLLSGNGLVQLDGAGQASQVSPTGSRIVVSSDEVWTAFLAKGKVRIGATSHGDGENIVAVRSPDESGPIGFLSSERVVYNGLRGQVLVLDPMDDSATNLPGLERAHASTQKGDLVAGRTVDDTCAVVSAESGETLWARPELVPARFSPDGRYLAAYQTSTGSEFETIAILDARTGVVVATNSAANGIRALPETPTAWEDDDSLLVPYRDGRTWAVLRLQTDGTVTRATEVFEGSPTDDNLVFAARP